MKNSFVLIGIVAPLFFSVACDAPAGPESRRPEGTDSMNGSGTGDGTGAVSFLLTDAPPDLSTLSAVNVTLRKVEVHLADRASSDKGNPNDHSIDNDERWRPILSVPTTFDLMKLRNDVTASLGTLSLPQGKITQIRLFLDTAGKNEVVRKDGQVCPLDLRNVAQTGAKIIHPFRAIDVNPCRRVELTVDFDLNESVQHDGGCGYRLKPVIKIKRARARGVACEGSGPADAGASLPDGGAASPDGGPSEPEEDVLVVE